MNFSSLFIHRPIATSLLMVAVMLLGILGYRELPVSALPEIDAPSLVVTTQYPGASATTVATLVTTPLERQLGQISGITMMSSDSSAGLSTIILQFAMDRDIDVAAQDVQSALRSARLPGSLPYPPVYNRVNPADAPIITLAMTSDSLPLREVNDYADSILAQKLSQVTGVGLVSIAGNVRPAVRVQVNPAQLGNLGLTLEDVRSSLTQANVNAAKGTLNGAVQTYSIGTNDQLADAARVPQYDHQLHERCAGTPRRCRRGGRRRRERPARGLGERQAGRAARRPPAARREYRRYRGAHARDPAGAAQACCPPT